MDLYTSPKTGFVEVICGPMFSGKTEELIRRIRRAKIARQRVVVFKPHIDTRYDDIQIVSHSAQKIPSIPVDSVLAMNVYLAGLDKPVDVIGIDEVHFFDPQLVDFVEKCAEDGAKVIIAGLDLDYLGNPFEPVPKLLALAESVTKLSAVCVVCGKPASRSQRITSRLNGTQTKEQILVSAANDYEARCRGCYLKGFAKPTALSLEADALAV